MTNTRAIRNRVPAPNSKGNCVLRNLHIDTFRDLGLSRLREFSLTLIICSFSINTQASGARINPIEDCGLIENAYGPFDYTDQAHRSVYLNRVERAHFDSNVYQLKSGVLGRSPLGDLDYTLRAFPNHHLALDAMARFHRRANLRQFPEGRYTIDCWFERAQRFSPNDPAVPLLYGIHLYKTKSYSEAESFLTSAAQMAPESAETHYNLGLLYIQLDSLDKSYEHAEIAYSLGFPLSGLRDKLIKLGAWQDKQ